MDTNFRNFFTLSIILRISQKLQHAPNTYIYIYTYVCHRVVFRTIYVSHCILSGHYLVLMRTVLTIFSYIRVMSEQGQQGPIRIVLTITAYNINITFKECLSLHSQPNVRFKEYFEYFLRNKKYKKN